jgi:diamine N-acetyltransferase
VRVRLRPLEKEDLNWILRFRNNPLFYVNFNQPMPLSYAQQLAWYETEVLTKKAFPYIIVLNNTDIGYIAIQNINWINRSAEISHFLVEDYSEDFMLFAHRIMLDLCFSSLNLNRIYSTCFDFNPVWKKLEELGFKVEGTTRQTCYKKGKYYDSYLIAVLKDEAKNIY